jgi:hypothetical protein
MSEICEADDGAAVAEALAGLNRTEVEALIQQALHPAVPVGVLFAALDRYTALMGPAAHAGGMAREDPYLTPEVPGPALPDAAPPDAAPLDATLPNAAPPDTALPNAAPPDTALPNTAPPNTAPPDVTLLDAAPPDALPPSND